MFLPIFILFILTLIVEHFKDGGDFVMFSRIVELMNSVREDTPREPKSTKNGILVEYKFGDRIYGINMPFKKKINWKSAAFNQNGKWTDITSQIEHLAGPAKDFYETKITPFDISPKFNVLAFAFTKNDIVYVKGNQKIFSTMKKFLKDKVHKNS